METQYDFPVALESIYLSGALDPIEKRKAVVRKDTGAVLGVVSDSYALLPHAAVVEGFRKAAEGYDTNELIQVARNGAYLYYKLGFPHITVDVGGGDRVALMLVVKNSYDGTHSLQILFGAFRLVCSNGMIIGKKMVEFSHKHIGDDMGIKIEKLQDQIATFANAFEKEGDTFRKMSDTVLEENTRSLRGEMFDSEHVDLPEYLLTAAWDEYVRAGKPTAWGYYNAMTYAITHKMRKESPAAEINYGRIAWKTAMSHVEA